MSDHELILPLALALATMAAGGAEAQVFQAGTYYEETKTAACPQSGPCNLVFSAVPAGKFFMARQLNCILPLRLGLGEVPGTITLAVLTSPSSTPSRILTPNYRLVAQGGSYVVDQQLYYKVPGGRFVRLRVENGVSDPIRCNISGDLSTS